jgi:DNA polymerase I-like protein with 3'-5' exonuclease and polymerase domains
VEAVRPMLSAYDIAVPEVKPLTRAVIRAIEMRAATEGTGYVRSLLGRRRRYPGLKNTYSGLNAHIQGNESDVVKTKLLDLYNHRKQFGLTLRSTVHDAFEGDIETERGAKQVKQLLDEQSFALRVPILWEVEVGKSWGEVRAV